MGIGEEFLERTKYPHLEPSDQTCGLPQPPLEVPVETEVPLIDLPRLGGMDVEDSGLRAVIEERRSERDFTSTPLGLNELSWLLWCSQGVRELYPGATLRTVPSAGARHALETYLLVNKVDDLSPGLYRFLAVKHQLAELSLDPAVGTEVFKACLGQQFVRDSAATFIWTAVPYRMCWRYSERGYRYLYLDAGHACQNLYLAARVVDCGVCAIGAYHDDHINRAIGVNGVEQFVIYIATVGKLK